MSGTAFGVPNGKDCSISESIMVVTLIVETRMTPQRIFENPQRRVPGGLGSSCESNANSIPPAGSTSMLTT